MTQAARNQAGNSREISGSFFIHDGTPVPAAAAQPALSVRAPIAKPATIEAANQNDARTTTRSSMLPPPVPASVRAASLRPTPAAPSVRPPAPIRQRSEPASEAVVTPSLFSTAASAGAAVERADVQIEDLSLRLDDNPYTFSSLQPPAAKPLAWKTPLVIGAVAIAALALGWFGATQLAGASVTTAPALNAARNVTPAAATTATTVTSAVSTAKPATPLTVAPAVALPQAPALAAAAHPAPVAPAASKPATPSITSKTLRNASEGVAPKLASRVSSGEQAGVLAVAPSVEPVAAPAPTAVATEAVVTNAVTNMETDEHDSATQLAPAATAASSEAVASVAAEDLPETPSRDAVVTGFEAVRAQVQSCAGDAHGTAVARVTVANSGRVSYALVEGAFAGTPAGSCIARALRGAHFPRFTQASLKVGYPFVL